MLSFKAIQELKKLSLFRIVLTTADTIQTFQCAGLEVVDFTQVRVLCVRVVVRACFQGLRLVGPKGKVDDRVEVQRVDLRSSRRVA